MDFHLNSEYFHPILKEPPIAHAMHKWDEAARTLAYGYGDFCNYCLYRGRGYTEG